MNFISALDQYLLRLSLFLDQIRQSILKYALNNTWLRKLYSDYVYRTYLGYFFSSFLFLPLAIIRPDILLILGPLIFGYPHMVASYRYLISRDRLKATHRPKLFVLFLVFTVLTMLVYKYQLFLAWMSFGVWPQVMAMLVLTLAYSMGVYKNLKTLIAGFCAAICLTLWAWHDPLIYTGGILILHNFMAHFHWILSCKKYSHLRVALSTTFFFSLLHVLVLYGFIDPWLNTFFLKSWRIENTAWILASWSEDPVVWYRWLVLYTYGLSMHYFIWLRALPETELKSKAPLPFRLSFKEWQKDLSPAVLRAIVIFSFFGIALWIFKYDLGKNLYFQFALLHGALEVVFLPSKWLPTNRVISEL